MKAQLPSNQTGGGKGFDHGGGHIPGGSNQPKLPGVRKAPARKPSKSVRKIGTK